MISYLAVWTEDTIFSLILRSSIFYSDFYFNNMSKSTIHRNSSSLYIEKLHQRQLLKEADEQYKQTSSLHISRLLSNEIEKKLQVNRCVRDVMLKSCKKIKDQYHESRFNITHHIKQNDKLERKQLKKVDGLKKLQSKAMQFKNRMLPQWYDQSKVERKLNQIVFINNEGHPKKEDKFIYSRILEPRRQQEVVFGDNQVINKYWNQLERQCKVSKESLMKIRENRVNMLIRQNLGPDQDMNQINEIKAKLNRKLIDNNGIDELRRSADFLSKPSFLKKSKNRHTKYSSLDTSSNAIQIEEAKNESPIKLKLTKELLENSFIEYLKHKKQRKAFLNRLNKEMIESEDAVKFYSFVKGGYNLDAYDLEGQFISLKRFNEAKQSFTTLNELYKRIKGDCFYGRGYDKQENDDRSFKAIVEVNELSGKIAPNQLIKLMKKKKIVK